jgi:parallel beta-helix repeat protein
MYNDIFQNWNTGLEIFGASSTFVSENVFHENSWGLYVASSENTVIHFNEIYDNFGDGIHLVESPRTTISDNMISGNWGAGIWGYRETTAHLYFVDSISATEQQEIFWFADSSSPDEGYIFYEHDNIVIDLRIDGNPVEVEISEVWFDDWEEIFRYEITYNSEPLALGDHIFEVSFFLEGEFELYFEAFVNVVAAESGIDENVITGNYLGNNGWVGIGLDSIEVAMISSNEIENNGGQGIWIGQSSQIEVSNNVVWSNWADAGINFYMTTDSYIIGNEVFDHGSNGILLEHSYGNQIMENELYNNDIGVMFFESSENTISSNTIYYSNIGALFIGSSFNMISMNNIFECYGGGIGLLQNSNNNMVSFNEVHDLFGEDGIGGWDSHDNSIMFNEIYNTDDAIQFRYSSNNQITDNIIHDNARGIVLTSEPFEPVQMRFYEDITISDVDSIFWQSSIVDEDEGLVWDYHDNMLVELTVDGELVDVEITDVWFDDWEGMFRYDMNYFSEPLAVGEHFFDVRFVLEGEFEMEFSALVTVIPNESSSSDNIIHMNLISDTEFNGIHLFGSDDNVISKNEITRSGFGAIALFDSNYNLIHKNVAYEHGLGIIYLSSSNHNQISLNKLENGYAGIYLASSHENTILKNEISHNENAGIELHESNYNNIMLNDCEENGMDGIYLLESNNNTIFKNELSDNQYGGVTLESNSNDNTIKSNDVEGNYVGILLLFSNSNSIDNNELEENFFGIAFIYSDENSVTDSEIVGNEYGIYLYYSYDNTFSNNEFEDNITDWLIIE